MDICRRFLKLFLACCCLPYTIPRWCYRRVFPSRSSQGIPGDDPRVAPVIQSESIHSYTPNNEPSEQPNIDQQTSETSPRKHVRIQIDNKETAETVTSNDWRDIESPPPDLFEKPEESNDSFDTYMANEWESLKRPETVPNETIAKNKSEDEEFKKYEDQIERTVKKTESEQKMDKKIKELSLKADEQREQMSNWSVEDETESFSENEDIKKSNDEHQAKIEEQNRKHEEERDEIRRRREERQKRADEEYEKMRFESQQRMAAFLLLIQMKARFDEKEDEWKEVLKRFREPLAKVVNNYYLVQDEFRRSNLDDDGSDIIFEAMLFAKKLVSAQSGLAHFYNKLAELSEVHDDRIFLKMIMKAVSEVGLKCDRVGFKLVDLVNSPFNQDYQNDLNELVSKIDSQSIPTTSSLKEKSKTAVLEDYLEIEEVPEADWFLKI